MPATSKPQGRAAVGALSLLRTDSDRWPSARGAECVACSSAHEEYSVQQPFINHRRLQMRRFLTLVLLLSWTLVVRGQDAFTKVADIPYLAAAADEYARKQCLLDLYLPKDKKDFATIVWFHGGGLKGGNRNSGAAFARRFTAEGFGVVLVGYRLSPKVKSPVYLEDAAASVAWTVGNIGKYK